MFKLLSRSVPKSNRSLTKFSNIYKKIRNAFHNNKLQQQKNGPKNHSRNSEDTSQRGAKKFEVTFKTSRTFSTSCVGKTGLKFLKKSLFPEKCNGKVKLVMFASTSSSRYFYTSTMNQTKHNNKKYFKNHRALELYKKAFEQCMKIKFEKHRIDRANNKIGWTPEPFKVDYPQELVVISDKKKTEDTSKRMKPEKKIPKQVLRLIPKKSLTVKEMAQKRKALEQKKLTSNNIKKKIKIVYPTHIIKHNLGLSTSYHVDKSIRSKIEILSNAINKRDKKSKNKVEVNTVEVIPIKQELNQNLLKIMSAIKKRREKICEENAQTDDAIKHLISQHPTVKKATKAAKMSINKKYNVILLKSQAKVQLKMLKPEELVEENVAIEEIPVEEQKTALTETNERIIDKITEKTIIERNQPGIASKITQHPILPNKYQTYPKETVRYPKKILVDKTETFDIDGICLRTKESYVAYVNEDGETLTKIPNYPEVVNTNLQKEQGKSIPGIRKKPNLKPVETQGNVSIKINPDNIDTIKKIENFTKSRSSQEKKQDLDANEYVTQSKNRMKTMSPTQCVLHYLKKLNELKDQTAVDRLTPTKYTNRKSFMVENLNVKKLNKDEQNKINSGEEVDVKKIGTVIEDTKRKECRSKNENVTKLEDATGIDEKVTQKIKDDRFVEKNIIKRPMNTKKATQKDMIEKTSDITCPKSGQIGMEETNEIHPSEVKPLYEKLLKQNREQVSANERKKFKLKLDQNILKRKSEAKRKVIISKVKLMTEPTSIKPPSTRKTSKYLLENYQPVTEIKVTEEKNSEKEEDKVIPTENKILKKILQQYTVMSKTDTGIEDTQSIQDEPKGMKETERKKGVSEYNLENNVVDDVHVYDRNTPTTELKIHSIAVEKQNYSGNDLTSSTETFPQDIKPTDTKDVGKDYTLESKYTEKLKNLLEPANQYIEKLKEAGENQMKSLGDLKTHFKNQLSENIGRSLKIKQLIESTPRENDDLNGDKVAKIPDNSDKLNQEKDLRKNELIEENKNQPSSTVHSRSNVVEISPNDFMDNINLRENENIPHQKHQYALQAYQNIKSKDATKSENLREKSEEGHGIQKPAVELKNPSHNRLSLDQSSNTITEMNDDKVKTMDYLSTIKEDNVVKGINPLRKEYIRDEPSEKFDGGLGDNDLTVKETFFYILKEKDPEQDDLETNIIEKKNKVDGENVPKIMREKVKDNHILHSTSNISDPPEGFFSEYHIEDDKSHENLLQEKATCLSQNNKHSPEKSLTSQKSSIVEHNISSSHSTNLNDFDKDQPVIQDQVFSQSIGSTNKTYKVDESKGYKVIEPSSEKSQNSSNTYDSSQNFVLLHNRPTIRKENPPNINPKTDHNKREKPKNKKDLVLPPPKSGDTPKMVEGISVAEDRIQSDFNDKPAGKNSMEESKYLIKSQYRSLESDNKNENQLHNLMEKVDLEDIVFSYRAKPRNDENKLFKNWITILAFIEELEITYKDGSDANLIKMSEEIKFSTKESDRKELEFAKLISLDKNEQKHTYSHQNETKELDSTDAKINLSKVPQKLNQSLEKAIVENNTAVEDITRLKPEKSCNRDDHPTFPKNTIITENLIFSNSPMKTEKPPFLKNNEDIVRNDSKQLVSNTKIDETSKEYQTQEIKTESTILSKKPKTTNVPKFQKKIKWPPKTTTKKFKFPSCEKKRHSGSMKTIPNVSDVSESKLSRRKVWMPRESPESKSPRRSEKLESDEMSVTSKLEVFRNKPISVQPSVSNFLEDNLKNWKSMNNKSKELFFRENVSDTLTKIQSVTSKTESSLLKTFLLDEDEEVQLPEISPEPNKNLRKTSPKTKGYLNEYSKEESGSYYHSNSPIEISGEDANLQKSKSLIIKPLMDTSSNSSKSEEMKVYDKIVKSILPSKQTRAKKLSNCLEENLKTWKLMKPNMPGTSYESIDKKSTNGNNSLKFSRLVEMFSLDDSEYPDTQSSKNLRRAHTTIIPEMSKNSYLDKHKLRKKENNNFQSTSRNDNQIYNKKLDKLTGSSTSERKVITCPTTPRNKQKGRCYEEIHSERIYQDSEKYKSGCNSAVELNNPKKTASLAPSRLKTSITETQLPSKSTLPKTYSLDKSYSGKNAKLSKKTKPLAKSIEEMNKIEKTTNCFSLYFRKAGHLNKTGIKKKDDEANAKKIEGKPSKCLVTLTLPNINSGKLKQVESSKDSNEPSGGYLEKILETGNSGNYPKDVIIPSLKNVRRNECSSSSSSRNGEFQKGRSDASKNEFDGNNGDDNGKKGASKLLMRLVLPKNRYILENKAKINGIQLQKNEPDPQKDGKGPGKLKKRAIFKLSRTFGLPGKHRLSKNKLENILKVGKVSYDQNISRNTPLGAKTSNLLSNKNKASLKVTEGNQIDLKDNTLGEMCSTVHLNRIMDKYRVNTGKLQDLNNQNVILTEVELFERRRLKEMLLEAFNKKIRTNSKMVRKKVEKITMERIMRSIKKQNKLNFRSPRREQVKIRSNYNTLDENKKSIEEINAKKSLHGDMTTGKTKHQKKQHQYQGKHKLGSDIHQGITAGSDKVDKRENKGIQKSDKQTVKKIKFVLTKPKCYSLEYDMVGQGKGKRSKKNMYLSKNSMKHQGVEKRQKVKSKYGKYCLQDQLTKMNKEKPIEENEINTRNEISKNTNYLIVKSKKHDGPKIKLDEKNHAVKKITSKVKVSGKEAEKPFYKYLLERPMSSQCLDFINSGKENEQISPVLSTKNNKPSVYRPTSSKYSLENQNFVYSNTLVPNEQFYNVTKKWSEDEMKEMKEQKSGAADNGNMAEIDQQRTLKMEHKIPEKGTELLDRNVPQQSPASNPDKIPGGNEKIKSMELIPKGNNKRSTKVVVEKKLPLYPLVEVKAPKQAVTKFCYKIQIPPKSIMQVLLSQPMSDVTTLTQNPCREIMALPKKSNPKCKNLKITYIRVNRKPEKFDESFLPALMPNKDGNKTVNEKFDFQMNKEQILKLRYQLLKQLREEFESLNDKQIDRMLQSGTEKSDNKSEFKFKLTENKAFDDGNSPKNNTEMLIKKLTEKDRLENKGEPEKPEGDPKKK